MQTIKTSSDLKYAVEQSGNESLFFTRDTMKFFGDTMRNYGIRHRTINEQPVIELYRRKPVKHGLKDSAYFDPATFKRIFPKH